MKRIFVLTSLLLLSTAPALFAGGPKPGTFGLGWYSSTAPVGGRVWISPEVGLDIGLGFADKNALSGMTGTAVTDSRVHVNVGIPVNVVTTEKVNFFIRPGVEYQTNSRIVNSELKGTTIITADLGAEWFVSDAMSLSVGHGLRFEQFSGSDDWGFTALRALSFENLGFHFYFN